MNIIRSTIANIIITNMIIYWIKIIDIPKFVTNHNSTSITEVERS